MFVSVIAWRALHLLVSTNQIVANSVFDFLINIVQHMYPALTPVFVTSVTKIVEAIQRLYGPGLRISDCLDNPKIDKPLREAFKDLFPGLAHHFISSKPTPTTESSKIVVANQISVADVLDQPQKKPLKREASSDGEIIKKKKAKKIAKNVSLAVKSASCSATSNIAPTVKLAGWDGSLGETVDVHFVPKLPSNIKECFTAVERAAKTKDDGEIVETLDELFSVVLSNTDLLEEEEDLRYAIADGLLVIFKNFLLNKKYYYTKNEKK